MVRNRSAPPSGVIPVLTYPDVAAAVSWLSRVFGFVEHVRIGDHRAQMGFGDGAIIVADATNDRREPRRDDGVTHAVMLRVDDVAAHYRKVLAAGAEVLGEPTNHVYGERQYSAIDLAGHRWTFTQSITDVAPEDWGGATVTPW